MMKKQLCLAVAAVVAAASMSAALSACSKTKYSLTYATWNLSTEAVNNVERQMIREFEERNNVKIRIEDSVSLTAYDDSITALAVKNKLPDVFMLSNMNYGLKNRYVSDITDLVNADTSKDWDKIPKPIVEAVHFKNGIYAIPFAMNMMGYFVNVDLIEEKNKNWFFENEFTYDSFYRLVNEMASYKSEGIMGLSHENTIFEWYPASVNPDYGWFTWDGSEYHLDGTEFIDAIEKTKQMRMGGLTYDSLSEDERANWFEGVDGYVSLWNSGKLALRWGSSYEVPDMIKNCDFDIRFIGVPGGRTPIVGDYIAISNTCKDRELAYKFSKWMSFDPEGIRERISREKQVTNTLPMTVDPVLISEYFEKFDAVDGLQTAFEKLDNGIVECVKVVPGYNLSRWKALTGLTITTSDGETIADAELGKYLDLCWTGEQSYMEHAQDVNKLANAQYGNAIKQFEQYYN